MSAASAQIALRETVKKKWHPGRPSRESMGRRMGGGASEDRHLSPIGPGRSQLTYAPSDSYDAFK